MSPATGLVSVLSRREDSIILSVRKRPVRLAIGAGMLLVLAAGVRNGGTLLVVRQPLERPDAIVSLASHEWERLPATARLARENPAASIILNSLSPSLSITVTIAAVGLAGYSTWVSLPTGFTFSG